MSLREKLEKRANLIREARSILEKAEKENRDLVQEEENRYNTIMDEANVLTKQVEREERQMAMEQQIGQAFGTSGQRPEPGNGASGGEERGGLESEAYGAAFRSFLHKRPLAERERRALASDVDTMGNYMVAPMQFIRSMIVKVSDQVFIRKLATVYTLSGSDSMGAPSLDADPADADWTSEIGTGSEDSSLSFGQRELKPYALAKRIKVTRKLLRLAPDVESVILERLAYKFAISWEKAGMTGHGRNQPLGVFTASSMGISTARDMSTDNTTTAITADNLINVKYNLKGQYWPRAQWIFHRDAVKMLAKLKDSTNNYLWKESLRVGEPDRLLNFPVNMSEYAPNTFTTGQYVGILGDFSYYWIADALNMQVQRLDELYAETNQVGFIARFETDGMPVLEEAFSRVKLA